MVCWGGRVEYMIRVLVVDDSVFMRNVIADMLSGEEDIEVMAIAKNGKEAIELNERLKPDVITLDVEMPVMNGLEALKEIMETRPTKVIMVSKLTKEGANVTFEALNMGALDFIPKPSERSYIDIKKIKEILIEKVREAKDANLNLLKNKNDPKKIILTKFIKGKTKSVSILNKRDNIIAIGISTGGPKALEQILPKIDADVNAGLLIVQHMPPKFTKSLAERLDSICKIKVKEAEDEEEIKNGVAYIAPGDYHMSVDELLGKKIIRLNKETFNAGHRPSANVLFESVSKFYKGRSIGVIMTGMGRDGADTLNLIRESGGITIGQSERTCIVFGMPKSAYELGAVDYMLDLELIPVKIMEILKENVRR